MCNNQPLLPYLRGNFSTWEIILPTSRKAATEDLFPDFQPLSPHFLERRERYSQFERIPVSLERQERLLREQIDEIENGIREVKASGGEGFTVKQFERTKKGLTERLKKLEARERKDSVVTFEQLGVDRLYVDEAHSYKNLFTFTKMRNVAGLSTSDAQKSSDMFLKCRYMDELTGGKGTVFATGTPVSNSMTELYTMQRYLQYDTLRQAGLMCLMNEYSVFKEQCPFAT